MKKILAISLISLLLINCKKNDSDPANQPCTYDPCATIAPTAEIQAVQNYLTTNSITATQHCSGLFYKIENAGTGVAPDACSYVTIKYVGKLTTGTIFDQTQGNNTYSNYLTSLIKGWTNGVPYIKTGGRIILYIPPTLGYGSQANGPIPANSILIFDIDLINVQ